MSEGTGPSRGGKKSQKTFRGRGAHPLVQHNFWATATPADRKRHRLARSARARAESACAAVKAYQENESAGG